jgi:hypothetical protein
MIEPAFEFLGASVHLIFQANEQNPAMRWGISKAPIKLQELTVNSQNGYFIFRNDAKNNIHKSPCRASFREIRLNPSAYFWLELTNDNGRTHEKIHKNKFR